MSRPFLALLLVAGLFVGVVGVPWLSQPPSNQELLANYAKAEDYVRCARAVGGIPWWTASYLHGVSQAFLSFWAGTSLLMILGAQAAGPYLGPKLAALACLFCCPLTMYAFVRRLCPASGWTAFSCGAAYLLAPPILLRLGHVEHVNFVLGFAILPAAFWSLLALIEDRTVFAAVRCAAICSLLVLAYVKVAVLVLPVTAGFALWAWMAHGHFALPGRRVLFLLAALFTCLAILPNLPALREMQFTARFDFGPFPAWQRGLSVKSGLDWIDWNSLLSGAEISPQSKVGTKPTYLGMGLLCLAGLFFLRRQPAWQTDEASVFRVFVALALTANWFAFGPYNAVTGQMAFLARAQEAWDPAIAISWILLILQAAAVWMVMPGSLPGRRWWAAAAILVYLLVPGFRLVEILPLYRDLRAPHDFFVVGGTFAVAVAAGISTRILVGKIPWQALRPAAATGLLVLAGINTASAVPSVFKGPMDRETFEDFLRAQEFLAKAPLPGRVAAYSGRYFYLLTPLLSGRSLQTEAFNSYLALRGVAALQEASFSSRRALRTCFDISGVACLLIDKKDPDTPETLQELLRSFGPTVFENAHFSIVSNPSCRFPAAWVETAAASDAPEPELALVALNAAGRGHLVMAREAGNHGLPTAPPDAPGAMETLPLESARRASAEEISIAPGRAEGWLIVPEAFHPDWRARQGEEILETGRAYGAFLAAHLRGDREVVFRFQPPGWYPACLIVSAGAWLAVGAVLAAGAAGRLPSQWTRIPAPANEAAAASRSSTADFAPKSPLVVVPTFNEVRGIGALIERVLQAGNDLEILVVDDASPDGTAAAVRQSSQFGGRLHLLERAGKLGLGSAYKAGFQWALDRHYDACVAIDADLSHDPSDIPNLLAALASGADAAIGSRYLQGVRVINWPQDRLFLSLAASRFVRMMTGLPLTDATSGFKAIRSEVLRALDWQRFQAEGYGFQIELHYFLWKSGARVREVPIVFTERREGETKMTATIALEALLRVVRLALTGR